MNTAFEIFNQGFQFLALSVEVSEKCIILLFDITLFFIYGLLTCFQLTILLIQ